MIGSVLFDVLFFYGVWLVYSWCDPARLEDQERHYGQVLRGALYAVVGWVGMAVSAAWSVIHNPGGLL